MWKYNTVAMERKGPRNSRDERAFLLKTETECNLVKFSKGEVMGNCKNGKVRLS